MNGKLSTGAPVTLALLAALAAFCQAVQADPGAECRKEAELYGIPPEQFEEYVDGCVLSRGGYLAPEPDAGETPPDSSADTVEGAPEYAEQPVVEPGEEVNYGAQ